MAKVLILGRVQNVRLSDENGKEGVNGCHEVLKVEQFKDNGDSITIFIDNWKRDGREKVKVEKGKEYLFVCFDSPWRNEKKYPRH